MARAKDSNTGKVELFNPEGGRIRFARYSQVAARVKMVEEWLKECKGTGYTLAITPDIELPPWEMAEIIREENWRELKRKMGLDGEKCDPGVRTLSHNASQSDRECPSFDDLPATVGLAHSAQIDRILDQIEQVA
jgi:hypothetical protein